MADHRARGRERRARRRCRLRTRGRPIASSGRFHVVVALLTPFGAGGGLARAVLRDHVAWLVEQGVEAVMPCGTTGEGPLLDDDETLAAIEAALQGAGGEARTIAHVGRAGTAATERLARRAIAAGADALSAVVPYYYPLPDAAVAAHYRAVLGAVGETPLYAYTIPARTGNELRPEVFGELVGEGLAGVKDSTKSIERHGEYLRAARNARAEVLMGSDGLVLDAIRAGGGGCVSAIANVHPALLTGLRDAAAEGEWGRAEQLQRELLELRSEGASTIAGLKQALARRVVGTLSYPAALRAPGASTR